MTMTIVEAARSVTGGVDTHLDVHVAAALDPLGALLGTERFATDPAGYKALLTWLESFGQVAKVGVEGTGSYGAGLAGFLCKADLEVIEVDRPNRGERRRSGKSDPLDAVEAARAALGGRAKGISKSRDGAIEAIRVLIVAKRSGRQARVKALTQMRHLVITAPDKLRCRLKGLSVTALVAEVARLGPSRSGDAVMPAHKAVLCSLAHRIQGLDDEIAELDARLQRFSSAPETTPSDCTPKPPGFTCPAQSPSRPRRGRAIVTASTAVATAKPTARSGASLWSASRTTPRPPPYFERKVKEKGAPSETSFDSSSATSPARCTATCLAAEPRTNDL
jgi:hypothetical protein